MKKVCLAAILAASLTGCANPALVIPIGQAVGAWTLDWYCSEPLGEFRADNRERAFGDRDKTVISREDCESPEKAE